VSPIQDEVGCKGTVTSGSAFTLPSEDTPWASGRRPRTAPLPFPDDRYTLVYKDHLRPVSAAIPSWENNVAMASGLHTPCAPEHLLR
jgi:hypothetical protein